VKIVKSALGVTGELVWDTLVLLERPLLRVSEDVSVMFFPLITLAARLALHWWILVLAILAAPLIAR
jgi:hypothetical protein